MHAYATVMAPTEAPAPASREPDAVGSAAPVQEGDFAAGLRTRPLDAGACGTFATGMSEFLTPAACAIGDFASGTRSSGDPRVVGDFATGMRVCDDSQLRPDAADRARPDRDRQKLDWARQ